MTQQRSLDAMYSIRKPLGHQQSSKSVGQRWVKVYNAARRAFYISYNLNRRRAKHAANIMAKESRKVRRLHGEKTPGGVDTVPVHEVKRIFIRLLTNPANYG